MRNLITTIAGRKGTGKSTLVRELIEESQRVLVFDTASEYDDEGGKTPKLRCEIIDGWEEGVRAVAACGKRSRFRLALRAMPDECMDMLEVAFEIPGTLVVVEEAPWYQSPQNLPRPLARLVLQGRHRGIDQIYTTQRAALVHRNITSQSDLIVSFAQVEPLDVDYLNRIGGNGDFGLRAAALDPESYQVVVHGDLSRCPLPIMERIADVEPAETLDENALDSATDDEAESTTDEQEHDEPA